MNHLLIRYQIRTDRGSGVVVGNFINVSWDDVNSVFVVEKFDDESDTTGTVMLSGPDLGADRVDHEIKTPYPPSYSFCDGTALQTFTRKSLFPYTAKVSTPNHFSCVSQVCDLQISDNFTVQPASGSDQADGAFEVSATSSNGDIKFSLDPAFDFNSEGQVSGIFSGYLPGTYTVTAKDELGCVDQITITIPVVEEYGVKYRAEYKDLNGIPSRVDILERGYSGAIIEVDCGPDPFVLQMGGTAKETKLTPIMPTNGVLTLWSPSNFFFRNLFTQDERKYQMRWYKNYGNSSGGFTPATLDTLDLWTNLAGPGYDWGTGSTPVVIFRNPSGGLTDFNPQSDYKKTNYTFVASRAYSFEFEFESLGYQGGGSGWDGGTFEIVIMDAANNVLIRKLVSMPPGYVSDPVVSGTYDFIAPSGAVSIGIKVSMAPATADQRFRINSFTNETQSESAGSVGYELKWLGYVLQGNYSEPYIKDPYPVTITATDGLADLQFYDFVDKDGNKYRDDLITIDAIAEILAKTDLDINIQTVVNRFEANMNKTVTDDPLTQCKVPPATFYHDGVMKCFDVLSEILKPFGAVIRQRNGKWFIATPEELVAPAAYREFDHTGTLITTGSVLDIVDIDSASMADRAVMEGGSQMLEVVPAYGQFFLKHNLLKWPSLIQSYSFEPEDIYVDSEGFVQFKHWNVNKSSSPGASVGIKETKALEGDYNFYLRYLLFRGNGGDNVANGVSVLSAPITIEYEEIDAFEFRFSYAALLSPGAYGEVYYVKLKWMLKIGSYYYNENGGWTTDENQKYNEIYIDRFNEVLEKKVTAALRDVDALTEETAQVEFILCNAFVYDFASAAALKATPTTTKAIGTRMKVSAGTNFSNYYTLQEGTDDEAGPDDQVPDDYADTTNERIWVADHLGVNNRGRELEYYFLDNVVLLHFPGGAEPPNDITVQRDNNTGIKINFEEEYLLNDIDTENINNSERTYKNYFKLLNGTPTQTWERTYRAGQGKLLDLLSNDIASQYKTPSNKITGSFLIDREVLPSTILNEANDGNRKYMFMGYSLHDKHATIDFDIIELKDTVTDPDSQDLYAEFNEDFSDDFYN